MSVSDRLRQLCLDTAAALSEGSERAAVAAIADRLGQPIRVAVAGPVSSGKSTLVNALLGQPVAPVGAGETTQVVTWFRYGVEDRARMHLVGGKVLDLPLQQGALPRDLPHRPAEVERLEVELSNETLLRMQVVDTPGLNTTSRDLEAASRGLLGVDRSEEDSTRLAVAQVDALVFVLPELRARDAEVLQNASRLLGDTSLTGLNTLGVLSRIDRLSDASDPWPYARSVAERLHGQLRTAVSTVTPVVGLLAETVACGGFTEREAAAVRALATLAPAEREEAFVDATGFLESPVVPLDALTRRRLYDRLSLYGLRMAVAAADEGGVTAATLQSVLSESSGFARLNAVLEGQVLDRADLLTAHAALAALRRLSYGGATAEDARILGGLRDPLERLELDGRMHRLRLLDCVARSYRDELRLPEERQVELERLALGADDRERLGCAGPDDDPVARALEVAPAWVLLSNDPRRSPAERSAARAVRTALELIVSEAS